MTEEKSELFSESEEEISTGENAQPESWSGKQGRPFLGSEARTTGGISSSEYSFDSEPVTEESAEKSDDSSEDFDDEPIPEAEEEYVRTESYMNDASHLEPSREKDRSALKAMISFFTIWRQDVGQQDMEAMEDRFYLVPVIGALFATIVALEIIIFFILDYFLNLSMNPLVAIVVLATVLVGSKFLHFDGLVDFGDGMVASGNQEKHIRAMKDTGIGAGGFGVALVVTLAAFAIYAQASFFTFASMLFIIPITEILIKNAMVSAAVHGTAGNGMASAQVRKADSKTLTKSITVTSILSVVGLVLTLVVLIVIAAIHKMYYPYDLISGFPRMAVTMVVALLAGIAISVYVGKLMAKTADKTFGSTSGDILGATNEIARPVIAFSMLFVLLLVAKLLTYI
ncbi:MAG: adenosylcobinamide-GDP ribazoletransferase [Candidatus Methanomethylophilaceae archaeon]|jgi:adenosylcobinamide-GDP ribazoletransferase